jgi:hypothetical protein
MPSRWLCLLIVAFWLAATGVLYVRELEPAFRQHDPPPYVIDLTAETQTVHPQVVWKVFQNNQASESYLAKTRMDHNETDDSFTLLAEVKPAPLQADQVKTGLLIQQMRSMYRVSREGKLREINVECVLTRRPIAGWPDIGFAPEFQLSGIVVKGAIIARLKLPQFASLFPDVEKSFQFPVSQNGTIFLPLHPVHRIHGVRPGRTWRVPEVDPLGSAAKAWLRKFSLDLPGRSERFLDARVRDQEVPFPYDMGDSESHVCWVIEYRDAEDEKMAATTWVEVGTDLVLCQEAKSEAGNLRLVRDSAKSKVR